MWLGVVDKPKITVCIWSKKIKIPLKTEVCAVNSLQGLITRSHATFLREGPEVFPFKTNIS